jgi:hypothetical protein
LLTYRRQCRNLDVLPNRCLIFSRRISENLIDDERRKNAFGLMMTINMLIEFGDAFDFTGRDFDGWCRKMGFRRSEEQVAGLRID